MALFTSFSEDVNTNMHKRIRLTPFARKEIWQHYGRGNWTIVALARFVNFYKTVKPHASINNMTPYELLTEYFKL